MMPKIPLIYVAGPYTALTTSEIDSNIMRAREAGKVVASLGAYPIIPHANTAHFDGAAPSSFWLPATLEACRRCDAILVLPGWKDSTGTLGELRLMTELHRPVFFATDVEWVQRVSKFVDQYQSFAGKELRDAMDTISDICESYGPEAMDMVAIVKASLGVVH